MLDELGASAGIDIFSTIVQPPYSLLKMPACCGLRPAEAIDSSSSGRDDATGLSNTGRECIICSETDMKIVSMAPCGHYFCTTCLARAPRAGGGVKGFFDPLGDLVRTR